MDAHNSFAGAIGLLTPTAACPWKHEATPNISELCFGRLCLENIEAIFPFSLDPCTVLSSLGIDGDEPHSA